MGIIPGKGIDRTDIDTPFRQVSFTHADAERLASDTPVVRMLPDVNVLKIGGQSIMDRGRAALHPLLEEIVDLQRNNHQMLLGVGGGTRARHAYAIALDLGMPTTVLAKLGMAVPHQNARILQILLASHGGIMMDHDDLHKLPLYFRLGCLPILPGMPPFEYWEKPSRTGRIPTNRTDSGVFLTAEAIGAKSCIYVKDEQGLFTVNPKTGKGGTFIPKVHAEELIAMDLPDLIVEPVVVRNLLNAKCMKQIQIIDGRVPGNLTRAINGEAVGTIIFAD